MIHQANLLIYKRKIIDGYFLMNEIICTVGAVGLWLDSLMAAVGRRILSECDLRTVKAQASADFSLRIQTWTSVPLKVSAGSVT